MGVTHREVTPPSAGAQVSTATAPGLVLNGAAVGLFVLSLWRGSERGGDLGSILLIAAAWFIVLLCWLFWVLVAAGSGSMSGRHVIRWMLAPSLFALVAALVFGGYALEGRFWLSRDALDAAADAALGGDPVAPGWIGLYPVSDVAVEPGPMVRFVVTGQHPLVRATTTVTHRSQRLGYDPIQDDWSFEVDPSDWFID